MPPDRSLTMRTYRCEQLRAVASGVLESSWNTFLLLIAVRAFQAGPTTKACIAAGSSLGLLFSPVTVSVVSRLRWTTSRSAGVLTALGAACFFAAVFMPSLPVFVTAAVLGPAAASALVPLLTQMYQENYPEHERGARFSHSVMIRVAVSAAFSWGAGLALAGDMARFPWVLLAYALAFVLSTFCLLRCPTGMLDSAAGHHPLHALRHVREDRLFRITLLSWMFMGFGNLLMLPLRVDYLANPRYGLSLRADEVAMLTSVIPGVTRLLLAPVWGRMFDRMNFFLLRVLLNVGFMLGILAFFLGETMPWLIVGAVLFGVANAGGDVAWTLWVTKIAPPARVADYMSVHTFLTGVRSLAAPFVAFHLATFLTLPDLGMASAGLILAASALLIPEFKHGKEMHARG